MDNRINDVWIKSLKHQQGRHNQKRHGWRYGGPGDASRAMQGQTPEERDAYRKRAGMAPIARQPKALAQPERSMTAAQEYDIKDVRNPSVVKYFEKYPITGGNRKMAMDAGIELVSKTVDKMQTYHNLNVWKDEYLNNKKGKLSPDEQTVQIFTSANDDIRSHVKSDIADNLSAHGVINPEENLKEWANTSNDSSARALVLQQAAAEAFGVKLSSWQQEKYANAEKEYGMPLKPSPKDVKYWKEVYNETQNFFKKAGYSPDDEITIYRGMTGKGNKGALTGKANYEGNAVESWSFDITTARGFSYGSLHGGIIMGAKVKVKDIISTCFTGPGCLNEMELIVLGSKPNQEVFVYDISE